MNSSNIMSMHQPLVSILMTSYNREKYIAEAIESVINSNYKNFELIICDDCSQDSTRAIAQTYEAKDSRVTVYFNDHNLGDYPNRNKAASYAKGKYLKYVDSDDIIYPESLGIMVNVMELYPDVGLAISSRYKEINKSTVNILSPKDAYVQHFFVRNLLDHGPTGTIIRTDAFNKLKGFLELRNVSDFDLWLKIAAIYKVAEIESDLVYWREHENQEINIANDLYIKYTYSILKRNLLSEVCPLSNKLVQYILRRQKKMVLLNLISYYKNIKDIKLFLRVLRFNGFNLIDFLKLPYLKIATSPKIYTPKLKD